MNILSTQSFLAVLKIHVASLVSLHIKGQRRQRDPLCFKDPLMISQKLRFLWTYRALQGLGEVNVCESFSIPVHYHPCAGFLAWATDLRTASLAGCGFEEVCAYSCIHAYVLSPHLPMYLPVLNLRLSQSDSVMGGQTGRQKLQAE